MSKPYTVRLTKIGTSMFNSDDVEVIKYRHDNQTAACDIQEIYDIAEAVNNYERLQQENKELKRLNKLYIHCLKSLGKFCRNYPRKYNHMIASEIETLFGKD